MMKSFGIAATLGFAFIALAFGQSIGAGAAVAALGADAMRAGHDGAAVAVFLLVCNPVQMVTLALATRMTGEDLFAYLALDVPRRRGVTAAVAALAVLLLATDLLTVALGRPLVPPFDLDVHRTALAEGALLPLWIGMIVVAPVSEEILFRGFLFRGFIQEPRNVLPGILAISLTWALLHGQYDWFGVAEVFVLGLFFGLARLLSGSTTLTILLHMLVNLVSVAEVAVMLGWV
jgi:membrane protease YdiL (CAAX protease family)